VGVRPDHEARNLTFSDSDLPSHRRLLDICPFSLSRVAFLSIMAAAASGYNFDGAFRNPFGHCYWKENR